MQAQPPHLSTYQHAPGSSSMPAQPPLSHEPLYDHERYHERYQQSHHAPLQVADGTRGQSGWQAKYFCGDPAHEPPIPLQYNPAHPYSPLPGAAEVFSDLPRPSAAMHHPPSTQTYQQDYRATWPDQQGEQPLDSLQALHTQVWNPSINASTSYGHAWQLLPSHHENPSLQHHLRSPSQHLYPVALSESSSNSAPSQTAPYSQIQLQHAPEHAWHMGFSPYQGQEAVYGQSEGSLQDDRSYPQVQDNGYSSGSDLTAGCEWRSSRSGSAASSGGSPHVLPFGAQQVQKEGAPSSALVSAGMLSPTSSAFAFSAFPAPPYATRPAGPSRTTSSSSSTRYPSRPTTSASPASVEEPAFILPLVASAAQKRADHIAEGSPLTYNPARKPPPIAKKEHPPLKNAPKTVMASCWTCSDPIAKLNLRGPNLDFVPRVNLTCRSCLPFDGSETSSNLARREASYADTLSAAIDRLEGLAINEPAASPELDSNLPPDYRKQAIKCDVCARTVASGTVSSASSDPSLTFTVETICSRCNVKYAPCSDCGGGGGRLSAGRWRCIELFPDGRKTCKLSHLRSPPANELVIDMWAINSIPEDTLAHLHQRARQLYFNTRMSSLARPEMLESGDGLARSFAEAEKMCIDQWNLLTPLFFEDIEQTRGIRRYLITHSAEPRSRRGVRKAVRAKATERERIITGFVIAEYEFSTGSIFYPVATPWSSTGHGYEANRLVNIEALRVLVNERSILNHERTRQRLPPYPELDNVWIVTPFNLDSKMSAGIERRGFRDLAEYIRLHPDTNLQMLPPIRDIFIPRQYIKAWQVFVLKLHDQQEPDSRAGPRGRRKLKIEAQDENYVD